MEDKAARYSPGTERSYPANAVVRGTGDVRRSRSGDHFFAGLQKLVAVLIIGSLLLMAVGWADDAYKARRKEFPALPKLLVQVLVGLLAFVCDIRFRGISFPWLGGDTGDYYLFPVWLSCLATVIWITGLINMVNFLDGVDGLASGATVFSAITLFFLAYVKGQGLTALIAVVLAGAALAFLRFNFFLHKCSWGIWARCFSDMPWL